MSEQNNQQEKKPYQTPKLQTYGNIQQITQNGPKNPGSDDNPGKGGMDKTN